MAKKKSDQTEKSAEEQELERRVDAMMSVETSREPAAEEPSDVAPTEAPTDDLATAPQLPTQLLKTIGAKKTKKTAKPEPADPDDPPPERVLKLHIDKDAPLDETLPEEPTTDDDPLQDTETDKAVDDITAQEADLQLAVDDARARRRNEETKDDNRRGFFATIFTSPWTWLIIIGIAGVAWAWFH
ncbi:MAG TPA: hypothetical protein VIJ68_01045 [Candidatus Saccharimonadales bacterium]